MRAEQELGQAVTVHPATLEDSEIIWKWRNDAHTRSMSVTTDLVSWNTHSSWYAQSLATTSRYLYVGLFGEQEKLGMCRFEVDDARAQAEVSINLNPAFRGKSLAYPLLATSIDYFLARHPTPIALSATIRHDNGASISCFTRCGFTLQHSDADYHYYLRPGGRAETISAPSQP